MTPTPASGSVILQSINLGVSIAAVVIPEVVDLARAIAALFQRHPTMTSAEFAALVTQLADGIHATNAATLAALAAIPDAKP